MNEEVETFFLLIFIVAIIMTFGFALGRCIKNDNTIREINQKICKQLYQQNTNRNLSISSHETRQYNGILLVL